MKTIPSILSTIFLKDKHLVLIRKKNYVLLCSFQTFYLKVTSEHWTRSKHAELRSEGVITQNSHNGMWRWRIKLYNLPCHILIFTGYSIFMLVIRFYMLKKIPFYSFDDKNLRWLLLFLFLWHTAAQLSFLISTFGSTIYHPFHSILLVRL